MRGCEGPAGFEGVFSIDGIFVGSGDDSGLCGGGGGGGSFPSPTSSSACVVFIVPNSHVISVSGLVRSIILLSVVELSSFCNFASGLASGPPSLTASNTVFGGATSTRFRPLAIRARRGPGSPGNRPTENVLVLFSVDPSLFSDAFRSLSMLGPLLDPGSPILPNTTGWVRL